MTNTSNDQASLLARLNRLGVAGAAALSVSLDASLARQMSDPALIVYAGSGTLPVIPAITTPGGVGFHGGSGAPAFAANKGDVYFRSDTPTVANQRIYECNTAATANAGAWTAVA